MATAQIQEAHPITSIAGDWAVVPADSELGFETRWNYSREYDGW